MLKSYISEKYEIWVIPLFSGVLFSVFLAFNQIFISQLTPFQLIFNYFSITVLFFSMNIREKNSLDFLISLSLFFNFLGIYLKITFYNYYIYNTISAIFSLLLISFALLFLKKIINLNIWVAILSFLSIILVRVICFAINYHYPIDWLIRNENGVQVFNFFNLDYTINLLVQGLITTSLILIIFYYVFVLNRSTHSIRQRNLIELSGVFFLAFISLYNVILSVEKYRSSLTHSLIGSFSFIAVIIWFIAIRTKRRYDNKESKQQLIAIQITMVLPVLYNFIINPNQTSIVISVTLLVFIELFFLFISSLVILQNKVLNLAKMLRLMGDYFIQTLKRSGEGVIISDSEGTILDASQLFLELRENNVIGKKLDEMMELQNYSSSAMEASQTAGWLMSRSGKKHSILYSTKNITVMDVPINIGIIREQDVYNEQLIRNQENQQKAASLQMKERLYKISGGIAHNINNLLNAISCLTELIQLNLNQPEEAKRYLQEQKDAIDRMNEYTKQVVKSNEPATPVLHPVYISPSIEKAKSILEANFNMENYKIVTDFPSDLPAVKGKFEDITEIFYHIIRNSLEAMPAGGKIQIFAEKVKFEDAANRPNGLTNKNYIKISISDNGHGITPEIKHLIFDPFFSTSELVGKGHGLTISSALIRTFRGVITFRNNKDKGVTFIFYLPSM